MSFSKLLVANRGEIAVRVIRACRELGVQTVAVYSEADTNSMHCRLADEAYLLGPAPAAESYLNVDRISDVIKQSGAEAVHPGYGFLSESAAFARAVEEAGAVWVGPPPEAMEAVGDKVRAKELAEKAGVPTVPGYAGGEQDEERLAGEAERIGYPVLVKASAGGGGRGMRSVARPEDFGEAVRGAKREAESSFGDSTVFLEKLVENPRHVEVQVIGDRRGDVFHLYERECSIQRRHQKVVEEAPSPALDAGLRETICDAAVRLAREAGYYNAGTVEFLLDGDEFYFLEMNARLQVEHPVTELVTGLDLVHLQLSVAAGKPLPFAQEDVTLRGSAIETRVYAEDPETDLPAGGVLLAFGPPEGPGIRNDVGIETGDEVSLNYDSMISKLIVSAADRETAVLRLRQALRDYTVLGVPTNLPLLRRIAENPAFAAGKTTTSFLEEQRISGTKEEPADTPPDALLLAAAGELCSSRNLGDPFSAGPWRSLGVLRLRYEVGDAVYEIEAERLGSGKVRLWLDGHDTVFEGISLQNGLLHATAGGNPLGCGFASDSGGVYISLDGTEYRLTKPPPPSVDAAGPGADSGRTSLTSPMPGTVVRVLVDESEEVEEGRPLLVLEAMKMEQQVKAPYSGIVRAIPYGEGDLVPGGAVLVELEEVGENEG